MDWRIEWFVQGAAEQARQPITVAENMPTDLSSAEPASISGAALDVDLSKLQLNPAAADTMSRQLSRLSAEQRGDQIQRLERGLLRLERTNLQVLAMLQQLVSAVKKPSDEGPK